jgi:hypothetical protein
VGARQYTVTETTPTPNVTSGSESLPAMTPGEHGNDLSVAPCNEAEDNRQLQLPSY